MNSCLNPFVSELLYKEEIFQLAGLCMEIHRELGKGHDEVIYKDALVIELSRAGIPFSKTGIARMTTKLCKDAYGQSLSVKLVKFVSLRRA